MSATERERRDSLILALILTAIAAALFAAALPAIVASRGASALILWPGAIVAAIGARDAWRYARA